MWVGVRFLIRVMWPRREEVIIVEEGEEGEERTSVKAVVQMGREKRRERERER